ncbi:hypothetical protein C8Q79DRAFT_999457 [Trametes meyenii]|nr:hypothetical protein C8Q79DRAFT_999457 [Trametes meyenii]
MPNTDDEDGTVDVDPGYLALYSEFLDGFRAHLLGQDGSDPLPASYFEPNAFWSASEKDEFFRALAIHSRLRPDLIAEEVRTKTVPDVCVYLAMLEQASRKAFRSTVYVGYETRSAYQKIPRKDFPIALEASEDWMQVEERMAAALHTSETHFEREKLLNQRDQEVVHLRKATRPHASEGRAGSNGRDREAERQRRKDLENSLEDIRGQWAAEDLWQSLDQVSMAALDRILREDEDGPALGTRPDDHAPGSLDQGAGPGIGYDGLSKPPILDVAAVGNTAFVVGDELIDPLLLEMSRPGSTAPSTPHLEPSSLSGPSTLQPIASTSRLSDNDFVSSMRSLTTQFQPSTPPFLPAADPIEIEREPALLPAAAIVPPAITEDARPESSTGDLAEEDLASMSPVSRRRAQKRLHMRRKRAQATGGVANENTARMKPGRKPKQRPAPRKREDETQMLEVAEGSSMAIDPALCGLPQTIPPSSPVAGTGSTFRHPHVSGMTLPYKRQMQFRSIGLGAQRLYREGVGLFHLQPMSRLMQVYNQLYDETLSEVGSQISVETIKVLHALVVQFVAEVMSRAIVSREQERIAKLQTKAWRMADNQTVSVANVKHALAIYGADALSKRAYFADLLDRLAPDESAEAEEEAEDRDAANNDNESIVSSPEVSQVSPHHEGSVADDEVHGDDTTYSGLHLEPLSVLRMIFPPFIDLPPPSSQDENEAGLGTLDPAVYMPWPSSSLLSTSAEPPCEEDLLPETMEKGEVQSELLEDENIDKEDSLRDTAEEKVLWARIGGKRKHVSAPADSDLDPKLEADLVNTAERKRKRKGKPRGRSKSIAAGKYVQSAEEGEGEEGSEEAPAGKKARSARAAKKKGKSMAYLNEDQLRFMEPDPNGRIKSSVYVIDSD